MELSTKKVTQTVKIRQGNENKNTLDSWSNDKIPMEFNARRVLERGPKKDCEIINCGKNTLRRLCVTNENVMNAGGESE